MKIHYREHSHAVTMNDRYGYYQTLQYQSIHNGPVNIQTLMPPAPSTAMWPVTLRIELTIHNHEDLTRMTDHILDAVDSLRGEFGEKEAISPSSLMLPGNWDLLKKAKRNDT